MNGSKQAIYLCVKDQFETYSLRPPTYQQVMEQVHRTDLRGMVLSLLPPNLKDPQLVKSLAKQINDFYVKFYMPKYVFMIDGAIECLLNLKRHGFKIGFVTNATRLMMNKFLQMFGLYGIADVAISADDVSKPKPHPMGILKVFNQLNIEPEDALFIGDSTTDMLTGKSAGVPSVGVLSGVGKKEDLQEAGAHIVIKSVASLPEIGI